MKMKWLLTGLAAAGLLVSSAVAAPQAGTGKPPTSGDGCKPKVTVVLKGTLTTDPGDPATVLMVNVTKSNRHGRAYTVEADQPTSINVDGTKVRRRGAKTLAALEAGDRVLIQARVCKADLAGDPLPMPALTAVRVVAHPAEA